MQVALNRDLGPVKTPARTEMPCVSRDRSRHVADGHAKHALQKSGYLSERHGLRSGECERGIQKTLGLKKDLGCDISNVLNV